METANKQSFWLIEKVLFESAFIHSHLLAFFDFNIKTGDYEIKSDCTGYEDIEKAFELINTAWAMWIRAKKNTVPEGFVLVPKKATDQMIHKWAFWMDYSSIDPEMMWERMIEAVEGE